jgi:hypothetical protein
MLLWKQAQQEVRQHWFIDSYIAAYVQVQYRVARRGVCGLASLKAADGDHLSYCVTA